MPAPKGPSQAQGVGGEGAAELATAGKGAGVSAGAEGRDVASATTAVADAAEGKGGAGGKGGESTLGTLEVEAAVVCDREEKQPIVSGR